MKIFKFQIKDISAGIHLQDVFYLINQRMISTFTETVLDLKVHSIDDNNFYFISSLEDQQTMIDIMKSSEDLKPTFGDFEFSYCDVTDEIVGNIDDYDSIKNYNGDNVILNSYYKEFSSDDILDKIIEYGVNSLSKHDKIILDNSVKYK